MLILIESAMILCCLLVDWFIGLVMAIGNCILSDYGILVVSLYFCNSCSSEENFEV